MYRSRQTRNRGDRHNEFQPLFHTLHGLVLPAPGNRVARRQLQAVAQQLIRFVDVALGIAAGDVHVNVSREQPVLIADHSRPVGDTDLRQVAQGQLALAAGRHRDAAERRKIAAKIAQVADVYLIALRPEHDRADIVPADRVFDHSLRVFDADAIARQLFAVPFQIQKVAFGRALRQDGARALGRLQYGFNFGADFLNALDVRAGDLQPHGSPDTGGQHIDAPADRHGPRVADAGKLQRGVHLADQLLG